MYTQFSFGEFRMQETTKMNIAGFQLEASSEFPVFWTKEGYTMHQCGLHSVGESGVGVAWDPDLGIVGVAVNIFSKIIYSF
jgi:hypothetical protein